MITEIPLSQTPNQSLSFIFGGSTYDITLVENVYLCNTDISKIKWLAEAENPGLYVEQGNIAVTKKGQTRKLKIPVVSPDSGLVGYPTLIKEGVQFKCFHDPVIRFGGLVCIKDSILAF